MNTTDLTELPDGWQEALSPELEKPYFKELVHFIEQERRAHTLFPAAANVYNALRYTPLERVRVMVLGQDPYHNPGQAHGLCFSVPEGVPLPPSLTNIYREMKSDLGIAPPASGCLTRWAEQGVLLLNAVLTVRAHDPNSHKHKGWEHFTDAVIDAVNRKRDAVVFVLWGTYAQKKEMRIDSRRHVILKSAHPSPLSAHSGFFGSKPFSRINAALNQFGRPPIQWVEQ